MSKPVIACIFAATLSLGSSAVLASDDHGSHNTMNHGSNTMDHGSMEAMGTKTEAVAVGVINSVDEKAGKINVTHEPVPELGWPKMTMDLPVTRRVDLSNVQTGTEVQIKLKQGRDKQFRVMAIEPK